MTKTDDRGILYLSRRDVETACGDIDSVEVVREVFKMHGAGQTILPDEAYLGWTNSSGESVRSLNMPGYVGGSLNVAGTKIINSNPGNPLRGLPRASGLTLLYDNMSTRVLCVMESAYISSLRTASVSALAADLLKGADIECLAVIGAGVLARAHIELLANRLPDLRLILIYDLQGERVAALVRDLAPGLEAKGVVIKAVASPEEAIKPAQLIIPVTTTTSGYIPFGWLQPGSLLVNVSLDDLLPEVVLKADKVFVDDWSLVKNDPRRLIGRMYRAGSVLGPDAPAETLAEGRRRIDAELGEIVVGKKGGRNHAGEVILVNPFGLAIEDVALAAHVYRAAADRKLGLFLER
jgi:ornithine cyclodeaminase/alanine dehydrogenase-like protein (mu-crystallin family)